ncbi:unnamed protein product [Didymodactylos carnosus]|uniref:Uncharacterized protein n=1 Tax=Didymodactylos carnosus TaxID=1234261 RepID=A0A814LVD5_9BILA|nr:unnamed protein product [Didymodactylos carnosus]CAF1070909.1 unnamed protein product [Didymodactylos carnosus]CAF3522411.1 unnamed protein product [Didymodactylos carnosus]CAF3837999.1 unnamed protein product [Didymodactylos carnosus]
MVGIGFEKGKKHFVSIREQLCLSCSSCACCDALRNKIELEYLTLSSKTDQFKCDNELLQCLLAECKYSYEQQYLLFSQNEQYLIEYEQTSRLQTDLIQVFEHLVDLLEANRRNQKRETIPGATTTTEKYSPKGSHYVVKI